MELKPDKVGGYRLSLQRAPAAAVTRRQTVSMIAQKV
jgi:hypothetical protein